MSDDATFPAVVLRESADGITAAMEDISDADLPDGDVTIDVAYSDLNYKDGMILKGQGRLVRSYPHVPGIDFSGTVVRSDNPGFKTGDKVVLTGWRVGETHWGGYAGRARVRGEWLVKLPDGIDLRQAMGIGTAGFTAMLAVMALEDHGLDPSTDLPVLVTGASGGLGSVAVSVLATLGYKVAAVTGRPENADYLKALGASEIIDRSTMAEPPQRPLDRERWAGAIDAVAGNLLAHALTGMRYGGSVASCGLAGATDVHASILPFLLRGVNLLGIDSVMCPGERRAAAWKRLARDMPKDKLDEAIETIGLEEVLDLAGKILKGRTRGRTVIEVGGG
ncbi:MAG: MDR family oxidoreductase [Acetobacterales bacterium]